MTRRHGITVETVKRLLIDSGEVRMNYVDSSSTGTLLGATRDGNQFLVTQDIREMPLDGAKGKVKGGRRIIREDASIVANFIEITSDLFNKALPGSTNENSLPLYDKITRTGFRISSGLDTDPSNLDVYIDNIAIIGEVNGNSSEPAVLIIKNAIGDGNLEMTTVDGDESKLVITFSGHYDPATSLDTGMWEIRWPNIVSES